MIIDCRKWSDMPDHGRSQQGRVFVDGVEVKGVWYLDTDAGFVRTYEIGDRGATTPHLFDRSKYPADWEIDTSGDVVSRTIRGKVEVEFPSRQETTSDELD